MPGDEIKDYAAYEAFVARNLDCPYLFAVMLPCEYLWHWVASKLQPSASIEGLYYFWIDGNIRTPDGAYQMANMLERYCGCIDEQKTLEIFRTAMEHELAVFTAATVLTDKISSIWQHKNLH